jgi:hypothetical protein
MGESRMPGKAYLLQLVSSLLSSGFLSFWRGLEQPGSALA